MKQAIKNALELAKNANAKHVVLPLFGTRAQNLDRIAVAGWEKEAELS